MWDILTSTNHLKKLFYQKKDDAFLTVRADVDAGYEEIGNYRNLIFVQAKNKSISELRDIVLAWNESFTRHSLERNYSAFISSPDLTSFHTRPLKYLSSYYWGACNVVPQKNLTGVENIVYLMTCLLNLAHSDYDRMFKALGTPPLKVQDQLTVHGYRKTIRGILAVSNFFPSVFQNNTNVTDALSTLNDVYDRLGDVEDTIAAYEYYLDKGTKNEIKTAKTNLETTASEELTWLKDTANVLDTLALLVVDLTSA